MKNQSNGNGTKQKIIIHDFIQFYTPVDIEREKNWNISVSE